ncbi:MAG: DUF1616 domain-containing protein, partial [Parcubacteria group bacterium]
DHAMKKHYKVMIIATLILFITSVSLSFWYPLLKSLEIIFGSVFVVFMPGYFLTYLFFPKSNDIFIDDEKKSKSLDWIERVIYSIFLSITLTTLIFMFIQNFNVKISTTIFALTMILANIGLGIFTTFYVRKQNRQKVDLRSRRLDIKE